MIGVMVTLIAQRPVPRRCPRCGASMEADALRSVALSERLRPFHLPAEAFRAAVGLSERAA